MNVYVTLALTDAEKALLERGLDGASVFYAADESDAAACRRAFDAADVALGSPPPAWVGASERLRWLQLNSVGYDRYLGLDWSRLRERLYVTNMHGLFADAVADTALAGILYFFRGLDRLRALQEEGAWEGGPLRRGLRTLAGARAVVLGPGTIGLALRRRLEAAGCAVTVLGRSSDESDIYTLGALDAALPEADVVASCLPETDETRGLFSAERLGRLRDDVLFVNVGRGSAVDEEALVERLRAGRLWGAVLDVTAVEPLPEGHPLWRLPNVLLTQHTGGGSADEQRRKVEVFLANARRLRDGESLQNLVAFA